MSAKATTIALAHPNGGNLVTTRNDDKGRLTLSISLGHGVCASVVLNDRGWKELHQFTANPPVSPTPAGEVLKLKPLARTERSGG